MYLETSPTATFPVGPSTKTRPARERSGRITLLLALTGVMTPEVDWDDATPAFGRRREGSEQTVGKEGGCGSGKRRSGRGPRRRVRRGSR